MHYTGLVEFKPAESLLFSLLIEANPLSTSGVRDRDTVDRVLLVPMEMTRRKELIVSRNRGFSDVGFFSEVSFESFDRIVSEKNLHVTVARQFLSGQRVLFRTESGAEAHPGDIDCLASEMEDLWRWPRILEEVDVSGFCVDG